MSGIPSDVPVAESSTEGDMDTHPSVPPSLLTLYEVLEWEKAVEEGG